MSHVSGFPVAPALVWSEFHPRGAQPAALPEPSTSLRGRLQYNNLMFMTAGVLTERLTGRSWDDQVRTGLPPLGMTRANFVERPGAP